MRPTRDFLMVRPEGLQRRSTAAAPHAGRTRAETIELAARVRGADERADRRAADDVRPHARAQERAHHPDVRPAACGAATQNEAEPRRAAPARSDDGLCGGIRGQEGILENVNPTIETGANCVPCGVPPVRSRSSGRCYRRRRGLPKIMSDAFSAIATTLAFVFAPTRRG